MEDRQTKDAILSEVALQGYINSVVIRKVASAGWGGVGGWAGFGAWGLGGLGACGWGGLTCGIN